MFKIILAALLMVSNVYAFDTVDVMSKGSLPNQRWFQGWTVPFGEVNYDFAITDTEITVGDITGSNDRTPALLTLEEAQKVAASFGGDLPTLDEWKAACYGSPSGTWSYYPTGTGYSSPVIGSMPSQVKNRANIYQRGTRTPGTVVAVRSYPNTKSGWGLYDCAGNAEEWTSTSPEDGLVYVMGGRPTWNYLRTRVADMNTGGPEGKRGFRIVWR